MVGLMISMLGGTEGNWSGGTFQAMKYCMVCWSAGGPGTTTPGWYKAEMGLR